LIALSNKIISGRYEPIPSTYSQNMRHLVSYLLQVEQSKRPTIHQVLAVPFVKEKISKFLPKNDLETEFSHTILHGQNVLHQPPKVEAKVEETKH
jgi:hypothetical protein